MDTIFFISLSFFICTLINDILLANTGGAVSGSYLLQISFQVFIFAMAVMVIMQWIRTDQERLQLESTLTFKNRVLSVIAHDLKNPIASIAQFSDLLTAKPELAAKKHITQSLHQSSQAALTLLDNLLNWGRSESSSLKINPAQIEMKDLVKEVEALYQHMAQHKELTLRSEVATGIMAYADPVFIKTVLRNLVANAIKFTRKGGSIHIQVRQEADKIYCSVADTGIGMKAEYLEQLKKEGYLSSSRGTGQEIGTGLGLQLVMDLLEKNNGTMEIESKAEVGSTFTFALPKDKES